MKITDVRIRQLFENRGNLKAIASITLDSSFAIHDLRIIQGDGRIFVSMPSRKDENGCYRDTAHPIGSESRVMLEGAVLSTYLAALMNHEHEKKQREKSA